RHSTQKTVLAKPPGACVDMQLTCPVPREAHLRASSLDCARGNSLNGRAFLTRCRSWDRNGSPMGTEIPVALGAWTSLGWVLDTERDRIFGAFATQLRTSSWVPALVALGFATGFIQYLLDRSVYRMSDPQVRAAASGLIRNPSRNPEEN